VLDLVVTRDEMRALKPDPDGWRVIAGHFGAHRDAVVVGDSWVDGVAAAAAGIPFVAYRANDADLQRWNIAPVARITDLGALPGWLQARVGDA
jgi:phosphoglycolate phosphatase